MLVVDQDGHMAVPVEWFWTDSEEVGVSSEDRSGFKPILVSDQYGHVAVPEEYFGSFEADPEPQGE